MILNLLSSLLSVLLSPMSTRYKLLLKFPFLLYFLDIEKHWKILKLISSKKDLVIWFDGKKVEADLITNLLQFEMQILSKW